MMNFLQAEKRIAQLLVVAALWLSAWNDTRAVAVEGVIELRVQLRGLFAKDRVDDFRKLCDEKLSKFGLAEVDYDQAEALFRFDPSKAMPGVGEKDFIAVLDNEIRNASRYTFSVRERRAIPIDQLERIEIQIEGLDCKACSLAVYEMLISCPGVELAYASFKEQKGVVFIERGKFDLASTKKLLSERGVRFPSEVRK